MKTATIFFLLLAVPLVAQDKPKRNPNKSFGHWINHHKKVVGITAGAALASGLTYNALQGSKPAVNVGSAVPCPSSACIVVATH